MWTDYLQELLERASAMRTAADDSDRLRGFGCDLQSPGRATGRSNECPAAPMAIVDLMAVRNLHDPQNGFVLAHERDVDRELAVPLDELLRPVQRINQPELLPLRARFKRDRS